MIFLSTLLISMFITMALIPIFRSLALRLNKSMDFPNPRKIHPAPMPRVGGIAMALGTLVPVVFWIDGDPFINSVLIGAWILVIFGVIDDLKGLSYKIKFAGQIAAALVVVFYGNVKICHLGACLPDEMLLPDVIAIPFTLLVIVGVTNAINLSDGLDGLAGGTSLLIFICIGYLAYTGLYLTENLFIAVLSAAVIGAVFGFLRFNTYPATIFMGDSGSQLLGFLAITLSLGLTQANAPFSPFLPLILLGFPVLDTLTVMAERIANGRSPFKADKNHFHHKLMRLGLMHTEAVVTIYFLTALLAVAAFMLRYHSEWLLLILYILFSGLITIGFVTADRFGWKLQRYDMIDQVIKGRLRFFKEKHVPIKLSYYFVLIVLPLLLVFTCLLPAQLPSFMTGISLALLVLTVFVWVFMKNWLAGMLRISFYLLVPLVLRLAQVDMAAWMNSKALLVYNISFGLLALFVVLTLKFTRRKKGFKATPMDFLILVIALVVPNIPDPGIQSFNMGFLATKIIVLFFSFEVLVGELRGKLNWLGMGTIAALLVVAVRGLL